MRKVAYSVFLVVVFMQLYACGNIDKKQSMVEYNSGNYYNKNWDDAVGTYVGDVIPSKEVAIEIAITIYNNIEKSSENDNYVPQSVFYDENDGIWVVSFWKDGVENQVGGDCSIALQKEDGRVLRIWFGE